MTVLVTFFTQEALWTNVTAALIVALIIGLFAYFNTDFLHSPKLVMVVKQDGKYNEALTFTKRADGTYFASFVLAIKNEGNLAIKERGGYWHAFINATGSPFAVAGESNHQRDWIQHDVYPRSFTDIPGVVWNLTIAATEFENTKGSIPYFFATGKGYFPKTVSLDKDGLVRFESMGHIWFMVAK